MHSPSESHTKSRSRADDYAEGKMLPVVCGAIAGMIIFFVLGAGAAQDSAMNEVASVGLITSVAVAVGACILAVVYEALD